MNLVEQAESDLEFVLEDVDNGFGVNVVIIAPDGIEYALIAQSTDIALFIDPNTGVGVRGRNAEATFRLSSILETIGEIPDKSEENTGWLLRYTNVNDDVWTFSIENADVDRKLGIVKMILGLTDVS